MQYDEIYLGAFRSVLLIHYRWYRWWYIDLLHYLLRLKKHSMLNRNVFILCIFAWPIVVKISALESSLSTK